jgi:UDP-GlcNAc:undecaprenyl-phosphate/decaprenyl-phosphate GlcNAc-1-phosphate transferase
MYLAFLLAILLAERGGPEQQVAGILAGASLLAFVGLLDDGGLLHHQVKLFIGMPVAALFLLGSGIRAQFFSAFVPGEAGIVLDGLFTIVWVVGITASFSILDHMDGLCAGVAAVAATFFAIAATLNGQTMVRTLGAASLGAALGFLRWNFNPAKIFMGDGGAMFLGFLMAALGLKIRADNVAFPLNWMVPILILAVPIFDTTLVSISRSRRGLLPFASPGKDHSAHRLANTGLGFRGAVLRLYLLGAVCGGLALLVGHVPPIVSYLTAGAVLILAAIAIVFLERLPYERQAKGKKNTLAA